MVLGWLWFGSMKEIPVRVLLLRLGILSIRWRLGCRGLGGCLGTRAERETHRGPQIDVILAAPEQISKGENDAEDYAQQQKQSNEMPAFQYEIAAVLLLS